MTGVRSGGSRAVALGARVRHREDGLVIAVSPGGFTFCLVRWHGEGIVPGPVQAGARSESACLDRPAGMPVRPGFRRAGPDDPVTGRTGFSGADCRRLAARHAAAGARILAVLPHETEMADPGGRRYGLSGG